MFYADRVGLAAVLARINTLHREARRLVEYPYRI
jgi:hypothetical protein